MRPTVDQFLAALLLCILLVPAASVLAAQDEAGESGKSKVCGNGVACQCNATVRGTAKLAAT